MIRKALLKDLDDIFKIRLEAARRLKEDNVDQWQGIHPTKEQFHQDIINGTCFVYEQDGTIFGMATFQLEKELTYQSIVNLNISALTLHRIAVSDKALNKGIAKSFFHFMEQLAIELDRHTLYVDTHPNNIRMKKLLKTFEFECIGSVTLPNISSPLRDVYRKSLTKC